MLALQEEAVSAPESVDLPPTAPANWVGIGTGWACPVPMAVAVDQSYEQALPHAQDMALLAATYFAKGYVLPPEQAMPVYLRNKVALKKNER